MNESNTTDPAPATIRLDHFLKLAGLAATGGHAKILIQAGDVQVNGLTETRRRRQLKAGDKVQLGEAVIVVDAAE